jgi:hypothetical protein
MSKLSRNGIPIILAAIAFFASLPHASHATIERTAKRWNVLNIYGGMSNPIGQYESIADNLFLTDDGHILKLDADVVYDNSSNVGIEYSVMMGKSLVSVGARYTDIQFNNPIRIPGYFDYYPFGPVRVNLTQWDLDFSAHHFFTDISKTPVAPYIGLGAQAGATRLTAKGYKSENTLTFALSIDFGIDLKIASNQNGRSLIALSSVNSYQFAATADRPKYLNAGIGLKFYLRP